MHTPYLPHLPFPAGRPGPPHRSPRPPSHPGPTPGTPARLPPAPLLSAEDQGPNSRDRIFSLRLTFECFLWQLLKPKTSCREVVRQVQALFRLHGRGHVDEGDSAYVQARLRLPKERLEKALAATAQAADRRAGPGGQLNGRPVKVVDASTTQLADTRKNQKRYPQPSRRNPAAAFPS